MHAASQLHVHGRGHTDVDLPLYLHVYKKFDDDDDNDDIEVEVLSKATISPPRIWAFFSSNLQTRPCGFHREFWCFPEHLDVFLQ